MVRINKFLAECNLGSRRSVEKLIEERRVSVNDNICCDLSTSIDPDNDTVKLDNKIITSKKEYVYIILNKPPKYIVTKKDEFNRKTVYDLLPVFKSNIVPVGRLDYETEGLLILTDDGEFANKITHPKSKIEKVYKVTINGYLSNDDLIRLQKGVEIDRKLTLPAKVFLKDRTANNTVIRMTISEGRNRQVRRMIEAVGLSVLKLKRLQVGNIKLGKLPVGMWRELTQREINSLRRSRGIK